jgi:hypothetical protein
VRRGSTSAPACDLDPEERAVNPSPETTRYLVYAGVIVAGTLLAVADWRWIKRPVFGALLVVGIVGGIIVTNASPFSFGTGSYYMDGVIISAASALALAGYGLVSVGLFACRRIGGHFLK